MGLRQESLPGDVLHLKNVLKGLAGAVAGLTILAVVYIAVFDSGTLRVQYAESPNPAHQRYRQALMQWGAFSTTAAQLDSIYLLPRDLNVWFQDCGQVNARYDGESKQVAICYELLDALIGDFSRYSRNDSAITTAVWSTVFFVFYHELGHALIDILDLPSTGREEDAVDQLATLILLNGGAQGRDAALQGAAWFLINARTSRQRTPFWDEHSLDQQRYFNILCWVYGSAPEAHAALLGGDWQLPKARAARCPAEYQRMARAWGALLKDHTQ